MKTLTIEARSPLSARDLYSTLSEFGAELIEDADGRCRVSVALTGKADKEVVAVLNAIQEFVAAREGGPVVVGLAGRKYTLHAV